MVRLNNEINRSARNYDERNRISGGYWQKYQDYIPNISDSFYLTDYFFVILFNRYH